MSSYHRQGPGNPHDGGIAGGRSGGGEDVVLDIDTKQGELLEMAEKLTDVMWRKVEQREPLMRPSIAKVLRPLPPNIPVDDYDAFNPQLVSIGPLHRGEEHLEHMEPVKWEMLHRLLIEKGAADGGRSLLRVFVGAICKLVRDVRRHYAEVITQNSGELVEIMVLDGCYILQQLKEHHHLIHNPAPGANMAFSLLRSDLILLENQIPFFVLETLSKLSGNPKAFVKEKAVEFLAPDCLGRKEVMHRIEQSQPAHLLHLKLLSYMPPQNNGAPLEARAQRGKRPRSSFSATELHAEGVKFKIKEDNDSDSILDVSFDERTGVLWIPQLTINKVNMSLFRNLVAFEQCMSSTDGHFTGYALFMDDIIHNADDVRLLGRCGIVKNYLPTDEAAAQFFNTLYQDVTGDKLKHPYYSGVEERIDTYCSVPRHGWMVTLKETYFGTPWSGIAVGAATLGLLLTGVQAYFSAFPR